jgi:uncharacterized protein YdhG (YjbR/CyaY superfamily)
MEESDSFFKKYDEATRECLLALKAIILRYNSEITTQISYGMPFFFVYGQRFCYLWVSKKYKKPYIGFVDGHQINDPELLQENRSRMKILLFDQNADLPISKINSILQKAITIYQK